MDDVLASAGHARNRLQLLPSRTAVINAAEEIARLASAGVDTSGSTAGLRHAGRARRKRVHLAGGTATMKDRPDARVHEPPKIRARRRELSCGPRERCLPSSVLEKRHSRRQRGIPQTIVRPDDAPQPRRSLPVPVRFRGKSGVRHSIRVTDADLRASSKAAAIFRPGACSVP